MFEETTIFLMLYMVGSRTRENHRQYFDHITSSLNDNQKPFWRMLKGYRLGGSTIPDLLFGSKRYSLTMEKAEILNKCFVSVR